MDELLSEAYHRLGLEVPSVEEDIEEAVHRVFREIQRIKKSVVLEGEDEADYRRLLIDKRDMNDMAEVVGNEDHLDLLADYLEKYIAMIEIVLRGKNAPAAAVAAAQAPAPAPVLPPRPPSPREPVRPINLTKQPARSALRKPAPAANNGRARTPPPRLRWVNQKGLDPLTKIHPIPHRENQKKYLGGKRQSLRKSRKLRGKRRNGSKTLTKRGRRS